MKISGCFCAGLLALVVGLPAAAQNQTTFLETGGLMVDKDIVMPGDLFELSQTQFNFGTARSMAMAGAFTSLGADLSSMSINPAGLGMFQRSELTITPLMNFARAENSAEPYGKNSRNRFSMGNIGLVINAYEGTGRLVSLNIGFGYNRLADLNYRSSFYQTGNVGSIADMYAMQMQHGKMTSNDIIGNNLNWSNVNASLWPAVLGYKCGLIDDPDGIWSPTWISSDRYGPDGAHHIDIGHYSTVQSRGSLGEYAFSLGANIGNKLYIGMTLGIQSLYQKKEYFYAEDYTYPTESGVNPEGVAPDLDYQLLYSKLNQTVIMEGTGVNFKLGVTYRPIDNLRLGVAFHTPTYYSFDRKYQGAMASLSYANRHTNPDVVKPDEDGYIPLEEMTPVLQDSGPDSWSFCSPSRLLLGVSYAFGSRGVIAVDYERAWYNGIRMKDTPVGVSSGDYNDTFRSAFKGANTLRVGAEFKPAPVVSLRAGFGLSGSWLQNRHAQVASPIAKSTTYYGAGIGFLLSRSVVLDIAYSYQSTEMTPYALYYADEYVWQNGMWELNGVNASDDFTTDIKRHALAVTLGFRF